VPDRIEHHHLRPAIEFAVSVARAGQRARPPAEYPSALKPFLKQPRIPTNALGRLRRAIDADGDFRARVAAQAADSDRVDPIGLEWLRREDGWDARVADLIAAEQDAADETKAANALRVAERRRDAAELAAARARAERVALQSRVEELVRRVEEQRHQADSATALVATARAELTEARVAARHANDREKEARRRLEAVEAERDEAIRRATTAEAQRDELLAERAERAGVKVPAGRVVELGEMARTARALADRLDDLVAITPGRRRALALPGGVARDSPRATEFLLRAARVLVLVDGYNVAKLAWPDEDLPVQRQRGLDLVDAVARRFGSELVVVFDGAEVVGGHSSRRRLARVAYSPPGVTADDVIRDEVGAAPPDRPVVVVTNDREVQRDVVRAGANVISSNSFLAAARA
jgi:predicted RNA-binding protein with PIN domain